MNNDKNNKILILVVSVLILIIISILVIIFAQDHKKTKALTKIEEKIEQTINEELIEEEKIEEETIELLSSETSEIVENIVIEEQNSIITNNTNNNNTEKQNNSTTNTKPQTNNNKPTNNTSNNNSNNNSNKNSNNNNIPAVPTNPTPTTPEPTTPSQPTTPPSPEPVTPPTPPAPTEPEIIARFIFEHNPGLEQQIIDAINTKMKNTIAYDDVTMADLGGKATHGSGKGYGPGFTFRSLQQCQDVCGTSSHYKVYVADEYYVDSNGNKVNKADTLVWIYR